MMRWQSELLLKKVSQVYKAINGYTKEMMISSILNRMHAEPSINDNVLSGMPNYYAYRAPSGNACAVGVFIPDKLYSPELEGTGVWSSAFVELKPFFPLTLPEMLELQVAHDRECLDKEDPRPYLCAWVDQFVEG
jgi:hypothetical protein